MPKPEPSSLPPAGEVDVSEEGAPIVAISVAEMERLRTLGSGKAVRMQQRAAEHRLVADRKQARGDRIGALHERAEAERLERDAAWALDPVLQTTGRMTVGSGGELALGTGEMSRFVDTVREQPDMLAADASRQRMELADNANALQQGLEAATTIQARNSLEKMLAHQLAAAHVAAMELAAEARELTRTYKHTNYNHQHLSIEAGRLTNASARMMDIYQRGLLTLERLRNGGKQTVVVQHVNVGDGGQAVVAGQVKTRARRRGRETNGGG